MVPARPHFRPFCLIAHSGGSLKYCETINVDHYSRRAADVLLSGELFRCNKSECVVVTCWCNTHSFVLVAGPACSAPLAKRSRRRPCCTFCSSAFFITWPLPKERRPATSATSSRRSTLTTAPPSRWVESYFLSSLVQKTGCKKGSKVNLLAAFAGYLRLSCFLLNVFLLWKVNSKTGEEPLMLRFCVWPFWLCFNILLFNLKYHWK